MTCETTKDREAEDLRAQLRTVETSLAGAQLELTRVHVDLEDEASRARAFFTMYSEALERAKAAEHRLQQAREWVVRRGDALAELALVLGEPPRRGWDGAVDTIEVPAHDPGRYRGSVPIRPVDTSKPEPDTSADMSTGLCLHIPLPGWRCTEAKGHPLPHKIEPCWPCKPEGCTHDDARTPGHPERVREQSIKVARAAFGLPSPEQANETNEAVIAALGGVVVTRREATEYEQGAYSAGYDTGCEDTRTAIWEAVQPVLRGNLGAVPGDVIWEETKAAIEGAVPAESYPLKVTTWSPGGTHEAMLGGYPVRILCDNEYGNELVARLFASKRVEVVVREAGELVKKVDAVRKEGLS